MILTVKKLRQLTEGLSDDTLVMVLDEDGVKTVELAEEVYAVSLNRVVDAIVFRGATKAEIGETTFHERCLKRQSWWFQPLEGI